MMTQNGSLKRIGLPPSWSFKMKCLMGGALETQVLRHDPAREASYCGAEAVCKLPKLPNVNAMLNDFQHGSSAPHQRITQPTS